MFLEGHFENLHFIHPILDKEEFYARAEELWAGRFSETAASFAALYFAVLSLGALIRVWNEDRIQGLTRLEWSRKLFATARGFLDRRRFATDLETVQCLIVMVGLF